MFSAKLKCVRISPKKAYYIVKKVVGLKFSYAVQLLEFSNKKFAHILSKALQSCVNVSFKKKNVNLADLIIGNIYVTNGPMLKKYIYKARGCVSRLLKRTTHVTMVVIKKR